MRDFEWIGKFLIGAGGTLASVALENVSTIMSILAALFTIIYLLFNIKYVNAKLKGTLARNAREEQKDIDNNAQSS